MNKYTVAQIERSTNAKELEEIMKTKPVNGDLWLTARERLESLRHNEIFSEQKTTRKLTVWIFWFTLFIVILTIVQLLRTFEII